MGGGGDRPFYARQLKKFASHHFPHREKEPGRCLIIAFKGSSLLLLLLLFPCEGPVLVPNSAAAPVSLPLPLYQGEAALGRGGMGNGMGRNARAVSLQNCRKEAFQTFRGHFPPARPANFLLSSFPYLVHKVPLQFSSRPLGRSEDGTV